MVPSLRLLAQISAEQMVNCLLQGIAIAFVAWAGLRLSGPVGAVRRFAVWFSALLAIVALPLVGVFSRNGIGREAGSAGLALTLPHAWAVYLFAAWGIVATLSLLKVAAGLYRIRQLRNACTTVDPESLDPVLRATLQGFDSRRTFTLCTSEVLNVPAAIGLFKPAVVLPSWAMDELGVPELNSILLHELAHLSRWDDWTNLAQKLARAVFFFHPAVWWIDSRLSLEREMACDDAVLARTSDVKGYAECLVSLTEKGLLHRGFSLVQAAISRVRQTTLRVTEILDRNHAVRTTVGKPVFGLLTVVSFACAFVSPLTPRLVSFDGVDNGHANIPKIAHHRAATSLQTAAFHPAPDPSSGVSLVNASFHPDTPLVASPVPTETKVSRKPIRGVPAHRRNTVASGDVARTAVFERTSSPAVARRSASGQHAEVYLVVMQERVYDIDGRSLLTLSVYRFATLRPEVSRGVISPKTI